MDRKEFLSMLGLGAATTVLITCAQACKKSNPASTAPSVDFTLNLTDAANAPLKTNGGYIYSNGAIVARSVSGAYLAVSQACTHEGVSVQYQSSQNDFYCSAHGSSFSTNGAVIGGPAPSNLKSYNTALSGNNLHVWG
jgi:cytochrome b6-f complex iron-sulfur subunit